MHDDERKKGGGNDEEKTVVRRGDTAPMPIQPLGGSTPEPGRVQDPGRFLLREVLGEGGQGEVCRAFDTHLQREVAIKFPHGGSNDDDSAAILDEARKAARLNHPNAVTIYECGVWQNRPYILMELVEGTSLAQLVQDAGRISPDRWVAYSRQILAALGAAHRVGIIHRDLKPQNVLVSRTGELKLTDFGIAHVSGGPRTRITSVQNVLAGTPMYMAPELWDGARPDARSDIYAFGCLSCALLTGRGPFDGDLLLAHLEEDPPSLLERVPELPAEIDEIVRRCLAKRPEDRFRSCEELLRAIERAWRESKTATAPSPSTPVETKSRGLGVPLLVAAVLLAAAGYLLLGEQGRRWLGLQRQPSKPAETPEEAGDRRPDPSAAEARLAEGRALLARAREATAPRRRLELAEEAERLLSGHAEAGEAAALVRSARAEAERLTEASVRADFERALERAESLGPRDLGAALEALEEARAAMDRHDALKGLRGRYEQRRAPLLARRGAAFGASGNFAAARDDFATAARAAEFTGEGGLRDSYSRSAEHFGQLADCEVRLGREPRAALFELEDLPAELRDLPAVKLLEARAELRLDRLPRARRLLEACRAETSPADVRGEAERLLEALFD